MRRPPILIGLGLIVLLLLAACSNTPGTSAPGASTATLEPPTPTPPAKSYGLNELVTINGWDLAIQKVDRIGTRLAWSQFSNVIPASGTWVVIVVDLKNISTQPQSLAPNAFTLRSGNTTFPMTDPRYIAGYGEARRGWKFDQPIPPGTSISIYTIYDIPPPTKALVLTFNQDTHPTFAVGDATR